MIKKNLFFTLLLSVSQFVFPLVSFPYSSRILGPKGIGTVNFIDSFTQYFLLIATLGIPTYGVREIAKCRNDKVLLSKLFSEIFIINLASTLLMSILYLGLALLIPALYVNIKLVFVGILMMTCSVFTIEWFYGGIEQFAYITYRSLIIRTISVILLFVILKPGSSAVTYYLLITLTVGLTGIANLFYLGRYSSVSIKNLEFSRHVKPLLILLSSVLAVSVYVLIDNIILGFLKGEEAVGIYATATKIVKIPFALLIAINSVIIPKVSIANQEGRIKDIQELISKSFAFLCVIGLLVSIGIAVSASFLVHTFAGDKFLAAVPVLQILSPVTMVVGLTFIFAAQLLTPMGHEKPLLKISVIGMVFSLVVNLVLIPLLSYSGAAITNILTEMLVAYLCFQLAKKHISLKFDYKIFTSCLFGALLFFPISLVIKRLMPATIYADLTVIVVCVAFYTSYLWFFVKNSYLEGFKKEILIKLGGLVQARA